MSCLGRGIRAGALGAAFGVLVLARAAVAAPAIEFPDVDPEWARLGQLLFWDPVLSGNRNISCGTCHHPRFGTSDGVSLGIGEGGIGVGPDRRPDPANMPEARIPRNAPALWNRGATEFARLFHDGRVELAEGYPSGIRTPVGEDFVEGIASPLAAQALFPLVSPDEMAGHYGENEISRAVAEGRITGPGGAWDLIVRRVVAIPAYRDAFARLLGDGEEVTIADIGNAIAAFETYEFRADNSLFDRFLRGEAELPADARRGMELFYGKAGCAACHSGPLQTDHEFHAIGVPQFGPGKAAAFESHHRDPGRALVTGAEGDAFCFRTPSLRNVTLTAPYGHDGAFPTLRAMIRHHLDPAGSLDHYDPSMAVLPELPTAGGDWAELDDAEGAHLVRTSIEIDLPDLDEEEIDDLIAFLGTLTDVEAARGRLGIPEAVPSGLPVDR